MLSQRKINICKLDDIYIPYIIVLEFKIKLYHHPSVEENDPQDVIHYGLAQNINLIPELQNLMANQLNHGRTQKILKRNPNITQEAKKIFNLLLDANYELHTNEELSNEEQAELLGYVRRLRSKFIVAMGGVENYEMFMENGRKMFAPKYGN